MTGRRVTDFESWTRDMEKRVLRLERRPIGGSGGTSSPGIGISNAFVQVASALFTNGSAFVTPLPGIPLGAVAFASFSYAAGLEVGVAAAYDGAQVSLRAAVSDGARPVHIFYVVP